MIKTSVSAILWLQNSISHPPAPLPSLLILSHPQLHCHDLWTLSSPTKYFQNTTSSIPYPSLTSLRNLSASGKGGGEGAQGLKAVC